MKLNVYVVNFKPEYRDLLQSIGSRYASKDNPPASTLIDVQALARVDFLVEIEAIAVAA